MEANECVSCGKKVTNDSGSVTFNCPKCGKQVMIRCEHCREIAAKYRCAECGFEGPN